MQAQLGREESAEAEAEEALKASIAHEAAKLRARAHEQRVAADSLNSRVQDVATTSPNIVRLNQSLQGLGVWRSGAGSCEIGCLEHHAQDVCKSIQASEVVSISALARKWQSMHELVPRTSSRKMAGLSETTCFHASQCCCRNTGRRGLTVRAMWRAAEKSLKDFFVGGPAVDQLKRGEPVVLWHGKGSRAQCNPEHPLKLGIPRYAYVLELALTARGCFAQGSDSIQKVENQYLTHSHSSHTST